MKKIGNFIKLLREEKGWTQEELAAKIPVSRQAVSKWEQGQRIPDIITIERLKSIFNVTTDELLAGERNPQEDITLKLYSETNKKKKLVKILILIILVLLLIFLIYYFFNQYKSLKIYRVTGFSDNYSIKDGIFLVNKERIYFNLGNIDYDNDYNITSLTLYYLDNNEEINIYENVGKGMLFRDYPGYDEYFNNNKLDYILDNLYLKIYNEDSYETIKLDIEEDYINNNLFFFKRAKIGYGTSDILKPDAELINKIKNKYHECEDNKNNYCYDIDSIHIAYMPDNLIKI